MRCIAALIVALALSVAAKDCRDQCNEKYDKSAITERRSCQTGCRLLSIIEMVDVNPFEQNLEGTRENCARSCDASFSSKANDACKVGCDLQLPFSQERRNEVSAMSNSFFGNNGDSLFNFPSIGISFGSSRASSEDKNAPPQGIFGDMFGESSNIGQMFQKMHEQMNSMMSNLMGHDNQIEGGLVPSVPGRGKLLVIKSGPGYHEEKTYNFGPEGIKEEVKSQPMLNDMMAKENPLERYTNNDDVEIVEPKNSDNIKVQDFGVDIFEPFRKAIQDRESASVRGFDFGNNLEEPVLPDEVHQTGSLYCAGDNESMTWSEWVSCLHTRSGLPRWLTAATLSLGIVFVIWLCLVIPTNAPKQRMVQNPPTSAKALEAAGKLEKEYLANMTLDPCPKYPGDLPPAYDEVAALHVAVPTKPQESEEKEAALRA